MTATQRIAEDVLLGDGVRVCDFVNLYGCSVGDDTLVGTFVEIQRNVIVGQRCKISSHTFLCEGVTIADEVFIGHQVCFTNDLYPRATAPDGRVQGPDDWKLVPTHVERRASIGSGASILAGLTIGEGALVGAGAVVTKDVAPWTVVAGNPAEFVKVLEGETG